MHIQCLSFLQSRRKVLTNLVSAIPGQLEIGEMMGRVNDVSNSGQPESLLCEGSCARSAPARARDRTKKS